MLEINFNPFPVLQTSRLFLREMTADDAENLFLLRSNEQVMRYLDRPKAISVEQMRVKIEQIAQDLKDCRCVQWTICIKDTNKFAGTICIWNIDRDHHRGEVGYMIMPQYHMQGYMMEAIAEVIRYGFEDLNLHSLEGQVTPKNIPSIKILERNGFVREAYFKENYYWQGNFIDTAVYSLINQYN